MNTVNEPKAALILGSSRGLGLGLVTAYLEQGWRVIATQRACGKSAGLAALAERYPDTLSLRETEMNDPASLASLAQGVVAASIDLLFINAGVSRGPSDNASEISTEDFVDMMLTNALSPIRALTGLAPGLKPDATVAVMSSNLASVSNSTVGNWEIYRASKASLNTMLRSYAARQRGAGKTFMCISPGWVKTDMGGDDAPLDVATSVAGIVAVIDKRGKTGTTHYVDYLSNEINW